jgi:hypothetical protein
VFSGVSFVHFIAICIVIIQASGLTAEQIPVHHIEGVALGFLVLRNPDGEALAYGDWKQVVKPEGLVVDDLQFQFKDGSVYEEITKFTQRGKFRLVSDQVEQRGPRSSRRAQAGLTCRPARLRFEPPKKVKSK